MKKREQRECKACRAYQGWDERATARWILPEDMRVHFHELAGLESERQKRKESKPPPYLAPATRDAANGPRDGTAVAEIMVPFAFSITRCTTH
jgi:hypothetical protein